MWAITEVWFRPSAVSGSPVLEEWEREIDERVTGLYGIQPDEIKAVEDT